MPRTLGPFDRRRQRIRCATCSSLHLKCNGQSPCDSCRSADRRCLPKLAVCPPIELRSIARDFSKIAIQPSRMMSLQHETCTSHFFGSYLPRNDFTARPTDELQILKMWMHKSAGLRNAIIAIGALDLTHHSKTYLPLAMTYYKQAVSSLRLQLTATHNVDGATLWTALLLALYELMFDSTGSVFMVHFANGLPALLREQDFGCGRMDGCRSLIQTVQMLEVMRGASFWSYDQPTLLEDPRWQATIQEAAGESFEERKFVAIYAIAGRLVSLNNAVSAIVLVSSADDLTFEQVHRLSIAAEQGWKICHELCLWCADETDDDLQVHNSMSLLSNIYQSTLMIALTTIFNFSHFGNHGIQVPNASATEMNSQVDRLCNMLSGALSKTNLAGILLLWPLRVAGAKSVKDKQTTNVLAMLREIKRRGFSVAQDIEDVLLKKWQRGSSVLG